MGKLAFLFPGQGAQYVGMGADLARNYHEAREAFAEANEALGFDLARICFEGPAEKLQETPITQPAILTASVACLRVLRSYGWTPQATAGLSLGEYTALVAADAIVFRDAVILVHKRGRFMEEAVPAGRGAMAAILGLDREQVEAACREAAATTAVPEGEAVVEAVNFNCPGQIVIAGHAEAVATACEGMLRHGAKRAVPLAVSGPFHSRLMAPAAERLAAELGRLPIGTARVPVMANVSAAYVTAAADIRAALVAQVARPVLWEDGMRQLLADGFNRFVEVGPGTVLTGFLKKIDRGIEALGTQDVESLARILDSKREVC